MNRAAIIRELMKRCKVTTGTALLNILQDRGKVSDNAVEMYDVATGDLENVLKQCKEGK